MFYREYTYSQAQIIWASYQCSKCGQTKLVPVVAESNSRYNDRGVFTKRGLEKREEKAQANLEKMLQKKSKKYLRAIEQRKYSMIGCTYACTTCGHKEPWAKMGKRIPRILSVIAQLPLAVAVFAALAGSLTVSLIAAGIAFLIGVVPWLVRMLVCKHHEKSFAELTDKNFPKVEPKVGLVYAVLVKKYYADKAWEIAEKNLYRIDYLYDNIAEIDSMEDLSDPEGAE